MNRIVCVAEDGQIRFHRLQEPRVRPEHNMRSFANTWPVRQIDQIEHIELSFVQVVAVYTRLAPHIVAM